MGQPSYLCQPPTGYKSTAEAWGGSNAIVQRTNFAVALAENRFPGTRLNTGFIAGAKTDDSALSAALMGVPLTEESVRTVAAAAQQHGIGPGEPNRLSGLILGSPEFQRR